MSAAVDAVREKVSSACLVERCRSKGCRIGLPGNLKPFVLIDMDHPGAPAAKDEKRCDFLFVNRCWVAPVEIKKGRAAASEIVPQLRAGAAAAQRVVPSDADVRFRPVAAYGGALRRQEHDEFRKSRNKVTFWGHAELVRLIRCGASLTQALGTP